MRGAGPRAAAGSDHTRAADAPGPMVGAIVERVRRNRSYCRPRVNQDKALAGSISRRGWHLVHTILGNENRILTVSRYVVEDIHGIGDICIGAPARINRNGIFPVPIRIEDSEVQAFQQSVEKIRGITKEVLERLEIE